MALTADFCRAQEALQRERAASSMLENVRLTAVKAALAWQYQAALAEKMEAKRDSESTLPESASLSEEIDDRLMPR